MKEAEHEGSGTRRKRDMKQAEHTKEAEHTKKKESRARVFAHASSPTLLLLEQASFLPSFLRSPSLYEESGVICLNADA
jgi:hypothetical protein